VTGEAEFDEIPGDEEVPDEDYLTTQEAEDDPTVDIDETE
jgi:hypothetical protein